MKATMAGPADRVCEEKVLAVSADWVRSLALRPGFDPDPHRFLAALRPELVHRLPRSQAEKDPRYKQLICYVILTRGRAIFHYRRSARAGEPRLAGRRSVGLGGHLNTVDAGSQFGPRTLSRAVERELTEEIALAALPPIRYLGIIEENSSPVSRVHLGIVAIAEVGPETVELRDPTLTDGRFDPPGDLHARREEFEGWSQRCLPSLLAIQPESSSKSRQSLDRS